MNIEIERKFLIKNGSWKKDVKGIDYKQGYLSTDKERTVRVRMSEEKCLLNIKGKTEESFRFEFEYEIPRKDALVILNSICIKPIICKTRYLVRQDELCWEIDEYDTENKGLIVAEIELKYPDQLFHIPDWIGEEVTKDARYYNANLVKNPYQNWK